MTLILRNWRALSLVWPFKLDALSGDLYQLVFDWTERPFANFNGCCLWSLQSKTEGNREMPIVEGKTLIGWGVMRKDPWDFVGLFESQIEAAAKAIDMGKGYAAHYGESTDGEHFVWSGIDD
jgi:hypothetical protein